MHFNFKEYIMRMLFVVITALASMFMYANDTKTLLIINSFNENEPWVNDATQPILLNLSKKSNVRCEMYDLNNALITDSLEFTKLADEIISGYSDNPPSYIVMIGYLAFNMRQQIKDAWGELPMLLVTTNADYTSINEYFGASRSHNDETSHHLLEALRKDFNFTAIITPEYYKPTVEMMLQLTPNMEELVFMSDTIYTNRKIAHELRSYLKEEFPEIKFSWLKADANNAEKLHNYFAEASPHTGLLLSTWLYSKHEFTKWKTPSISDLKLLSTSRNPIFTLHESYIALGAIGGVYPDPKPSQEREAQVIEAMIAGKSMRDIPFFYNEESYPCINYRLLKKYGLSEDNCPIDTVYYQRPLGFWDKYMWQTLALTFLALLIILFLTTKNSQQHKKLLALKRNSEFVENMPIPYSTATLKYDDAGNVSTISYKVKNAAFERLLDSNVVPDSPYLLFPANFIGPKVDQLLNDGKPQTFDYHFDKTDTYYEFILCRVNSSIYGKNIQTIDIFAIDITRRHKSEKSLANATRLLDLTLDAAKLTPWQYVMDKDIILYDYHTNGSDDENIELDFEKFVESQIYPDDQEALLKVREDVRIGRTRNFSILLRKNSTTEPDGFTWAEFEGTVTNIEDGSKRSIVVGSTRDVNERIRTQQAMTVALERANESDRMKSAFLASISHEIRTPLNAIIGFSNVIAHTEDRNERMEFCEIINKNNEQLLALIDDVLDLAKIESNTIDINYAKTDINEMMEQVKKTMAMKVPHGIRFTLINEKDGCRAEIDENRVRQILTNMISNACKFTSAGAIIFGYNVTEEGTIRFYVRDTGIGLSEENQKKVFDRFFKLNDFVPGTGLGLTICYNLVHKMGGEIGVESQGEGKGSTFWFTLPYVPAKSATSNSEDKTSDIFFKRQMPKLPLRPGRTKVKILIAEDNESNYRLLDHLMHDHFDIVRANNGHEAVRAFLREDPDVVLMDISMPGMDGYKALKEIRKFSASVPIIAVTAYVYASDKAKILQFGFDGYVSKPVTQKAILDAMIHAMVK